MKEAADAIEELENKMLNWQATADDHWEAYQHWFHKYMDDMPKWMPVPEHGRLIDADEFFKALTMDDCISILESMHVQSILSDATTIIHAEEGGEG